MFDTETPFHLLRPNVVRPVPVSDDLISDLGWLPAGVMLTAALERMDRDRLSGHERVSVLKARARQVAHDQAELLADIESVSEAIGELINDPDPDDRTVYDTTSTEISAALTLTRRSAEVHVDLAYLLCQRLPTVWEALSDGLIDLARARLLADQTSHLPQDLARQVCDIALERAGSQTTGQLRARIQRLIISIDPAAAQDRYEQRLLEARVVCEPTDTGTANLYGLDLPADEASRAMRRINRMARKRKAKGDKRPIDLIRAELFLILLNGGNGQINGSDADRAQVNLNAELTTVLGLDEQPGEIPGFGPVISDVVRKIVANQPEADWNFGITHHTQLLDVITTRR